nr:MAG TPA: hypothetical protein [Microviridae sp.]
MFLRQTSANFFSPTNIHADALCFELTMFHNSLFFVSATNFCKLF